MDEVESKVTESGDEVIYVKEKPLLKFVIGLVAAIAGITVFLFLLGMFMAFVGFRPPTFDKQIIEDQWRKTVGDPAVSYQDCVDKGGLVQESFPPSCVYEDDSFTQSLEDACSERTDEVVDPEDPCFSLANPAAATAYEVGERAGELYEDSKDAGSAFIEGFLDSMSES